MAGNPDPHERLIPWAIQEHNGMTTEMWYWDQNTRTMRKKTLIGPEPIHQSQAYTDMVDMETTWERYRVFDEDRNPIEAVLWNVIRRRGDPVRILMTMEAFRLQRTLFIITRPNHMRLKEPPEPTPETSPEGTPEHTPSEWEERDSNEDIPGAQAPLPQQQPALGAQELSLQEELL